VLIRTSFDASNQRYGSPRIHRDLREEHDEHVSRKRVIRLMQEEGVKARQRKRFVCTTDSDHDLPVAANLLNREFTAEAPNQRWAGDTTEFKIGESGKLYLAAILDLFSRFVVGWAVSAVNDRHLTLAALTMALNRDSATDSNRVGRAAWILRDRRHCTLSKQILSRTCAHRGPP
jgi:transposase InsO family protein